MIDDATLLRLLQIADSQFPVGSFAHSGGVETYAHLGLDAAGLRALLRHQLELGWGRLDLSAASLAWAHAADGAALRVLAGRIDAWKVVPAVRQASVGLGRRMIRLARRLYPDLAPGAELAPPHQCVVAGALGRRLGLPLRPLLLAFGHAALNASLAAATRCMPISPEQAQETLVALHPVLARAVDAAASDPDRGCFSATFALDIRAQQQASLPTRLFQS